MKVYFNNEVFKDVIVGEFTPYFISLDYEKTGGGWSTGFAISEYSYRKENPTKAKVLIKKTRYYTFFDIYSDWGGFNTVGIPNTEEKVISDFIVQCKKEELLNK